MHLFPGTVFSQNPSPENNTVKNSNAPGAEIYVDQVIDAESLAQEIEAEKKRERVIAPQWAPGNLAITYRHYNNDTNVRSAHSEHGVELRWRQETSEHGTYDMQIEGVTSEGYAEPLEPDGNRIQIRQHNYVINSELQLDSNLFHYRSVVPRLVDESYRFRLPSTILQGMGNRIYYGDTTFFFNFGEIGRYKGTAAQAYQPTEGNLYGMGVQHDFNRHWDIAFQFWNTDSPEQVETHQSLAAAAEYKPDNHDQIHQLHVLGDSLGKTGLWYDGHMKIGRWKHRAGAQYLPPGLLWTDMPINSDYQGIYWRGDRNSYRWLWSLGSEISENNLDDAPHVPGYISTTSFASLAWQFRHKTQFGGNANVQTHTAESGTALHDYHRYTFRAFADHHFPIGRTRIEPAIEVDNKDVDYTRKYGLRWDQDWDIFLNHRLNSEIRYQTSNRQEEDLNFKLYFEHYYPWGLRLNGSLQQYYLSFPELGSSKGTSISMGLGWQFLTNWLMSLNADYNTGDFKLEMGEDTKIKGTNVLFAISYNIDIGKRRDLYGMDTGDPGRGRIVGRVFLDENRNGYFDLGEKALSDLTVYLDGRFTTATGPKGMFEFWPVAAGEHHITIALQDVPLPWSLMDEEPQRVVVPVRGETEFNFALVRLNE